MSSDFVEGPELFLYYTFKFKMIRMITEHVLTSNIKAKIEFSANPEATAEDIGRIWAKIDYWLETTNQALALSALNPVAVTAVIDEDTGDCRFLNPIMILPGEPTEEVLGYVLQAKLTALGEDVLAFGALEIESEESHGVTFNLIGDPAEMLPVMEEWMGPGNWFKVPWWHRDDGSMLDAKPNEDADLSVLPEWAYNWDFLGARPKPNMTKGGGSVITGRFRPRLVNDGETADDTDQKD